MKITLRSTLKNIAFVMAFVSVLPSLCFAQLHGKPRQKIGLVLSGGGARGAAHVGAIKVLDELRIPIDYIAGTSMGAIVGGLYASGMDANELERAISNADWPQLLSDKPPRSRRTLRRKADDVGFLVDFEMGLRKRKLLFPKGLVQGQTLSLELRKLLIDVALIDDFDQLPIPFRAIAADIATGDEVILNSGDLAKSIRASMSVPGVFKPVNIDGKLLVDGGIANNLPIDVVKKMGADIIIVVDVSSPPVAQNELDSPLKITSQMLTILIKKQSNQQKALMTSDDVLITPELGQLSSAAFDKTVQAISIGELTARKAIDDLTRLSLSGKDYADHRFAVLRGRQEPPIISQVVIENESRLSTSALRARLSDHIGKPLEPLLLDNEIANIYGFNTFETVDYSIIPSKSGNELRVVSKSKDWGPNYLQFGINLEDDFKGNSSYNLAARLTRTEINKLGGEVRVDFVDGQSPELSIELYQPLDYDSRWFTAAKLQYQRSSDGLFKDGNQLALIRSQATNASFSFGRNFGNTSELRFSLSRSYINGDIQIGDPSIPSMSDDFTSFNLSYQFDTIDRISIPRSGSLYALSWAGTRAGFGSNQSLDLIGLFALKPKTWGRNTLLHWWDLNTVVDESETSTNAFSLGGLFSLSGYSPGELAGQHSAIGRLLYYRRVSDKITGLLGTQIYLGASIEAGNVWQDSNDISVSNLLIAGSLFVIVDTVIGPLYLAYGAAEGERDSAYLFLGQTF